MLKNHRFEFVIIKKNHVHVFLLFYTNTFINTLHIIKTNTSTIFVSTEALKGRNVVLNRLGVYLKIVLL